MKTKLTLEFNDTEEEMRFAKFIKRSVKPTDAIGSVGCKRLNLAKVFYPKTETFTIC